MDEPIHHHYLPVFYLSRWVGTDGCLCRYSRPHGDEVKTKRIVPKGTGFEPRLYEIRGVPPERAQVMEKDFMSKLDAEAAKALTLLESGLPERDWTSGPRSSWSRFLLTQMMRNPEDIAQLKSSVKEDWSKAIPELEEIYAARRSESDPPTIREYLEQQDLEQTDRAAFSIARKLMNHSGICQIFNNMHWLVLDTPADAYSLLTSDRPIWMTPTLKEENAFLIMPIGPRKLFTAAVNVTTQERLRQQRRTELVKEVNKLTVQHAVKCVYGINGTMQKFVQKHMATKRHSTLIERLAASRGHEIVAPDSPMRKG